MASPVLSFRVEDDLLRSSIAWFRQRSVIANITRSTPWPVDSWRLSAITEGIADADAGNLTDLEAIKAKWVNRAKYCVGGQSGQLS